MQSKTEYPTIYLTPDEFAKAKARVWQPKCKRCECGVKVHPNTPRAGMHTAYCACCGARFMVVEVVQ